MPQAWYAVWIVELGEGRYLKCQNDGLIVAFEHDPESFDATVDLRQWEELEP